MLSISKEEVPDYLRASPLYQNVFQNDSRDSHYAAAELAVDIPTDCLKPNPTVQTLDDIHFLLKTVRYWLIPEYIETSSDLFDFVLHDKQCLESFLKDFSEDIPFLIKLNTVLQLDSGLTLMGMAAKCGLLGFVRYLRSKDVKWETGVTMNFTSVAAKYGHFECLQYAVENGCKFREDTCELAAGNGHVSCLKYAYENGASIASGPWAAAVRNGHLKCVEYLVHCAPKIFRNNKNLSRIACREGNLEMLSYLLTTAGCSADASVANAAAAFDRIECLKLLLSVNCPFTSDTLYVAVHCGAIECTKFLHEWGCVWEDSTLLTCRNRKVKTARGVDEESPFPLDALQACFMYAAEHGCSLYPATYVLATDIDSLKLLRFLHQNDVQVELNVVGAAIMRNRISCLQYLLEIHAPAKAGCYVLGVRYNSLASLECLYAHGVPMDDKATEEAVKSDNPELLRYLLERGCPVGNFLNKAAISSKRDCLQILHEHGLQLRESVVTLACTAGSAQCLQYALSQGCPYSPSHSIVVAGKDYMSCLQILHEHGLPLAEEVVLAACEAGAAQCLQYALSHGCSFSADLCVLVAKKGYANCLKCLHEHGAPMTMEVYNAALQAGKFDCVAFAVAHGPSEMGQEACVAAASYKWFSNLQQLHVSGASWDINTCLTAVRSGSFECLKYAVKNGCPVDVTVLAEAARCNEKTMLKWLHKKCIPWDASVTAAAVKSDSVECLKYAIQWHCPYDVPEEKLEHSPHCRPYMLNRGNWMVGRARKRQAAANALASNLQEVL